MPIVLDGALYYTTTEAAARLDVRPESLRDAVKRGRIRVRRLEDLNRNVIAADELERYRAEQAGGQGWAARKAPGYTPNTERAAYLREYRQRKRQGSAATPAQGAAQSPQDQE